MSDTMKSTGASCPKCQERCPAEYAQKGQPARWSCHKCGAGGELIGQVAGASSPAQTTGKTVHPAPQGILRSRP